MTNPIPSPHCPQCGRLEPRPEIRFCENCGAVLPAVERTASAGFSGGAFIDPPPRPEVPQPALRPLSPPQEPFWDAAASVFPVEPATVPPEPPKRPGFLAEWLSATGTLGFSMLSIAILLLLGFLFVFIGAHC